MKATPGRIAVVTGASSGIGEATARALASRGWTCVLLARRQERLHALAGQIGGEVEPCDLADAQLLGAAASRIRERHPQVGILVNNAGIPARGTVLDCDAELLERVLAVNYLAGVRLTRELLPSLTASAARHGRSHVVNVASVAGTIALGQAGAYAASKHAQVAFSRALRASLRTRRIDVHTVMPGFVATEGFPQQALLDHRLTRPFVTRPEVVADAIVEAVARGRREIVVPRIPYRLAGIVQGISPGIAALLARWALERDVAFSASLPGSLSDSAAAP